MSKDGGSLSWTLRDGSGNPYYSFDPNVVPDDIIVPQGFALGDVILVCGGRDFSNPRYGWKILDSLHEQHPIRWLIAGHISFVPQLVFSGIFERNGRADRGRPECIAHVIMGHPVQPCPFILNVFRLH